jgi:prepilin-type N-terminal cleavage/methylation domain-containing protein
VTNPETLDSKRAPGFTLVELLVVIAIMAVLAGLLVAGLHSATEKGKSARCIGNLRQIGLGVTVYADENANQFHHVAGSIPDHGQWTANPWTSELLPPNHPDAYWGVAYARYLGGSKELFRCPSAQHVDEWREEGLPYPASFWLNSTYGINRYLVRLYNSTNSPVLKVTGLKSPQTTVLAQDAAEQRMEGEKDSLGLFPGESEILSQWRFALQRLYPERQMWLEWFRHRKRCNTLWVPGQVSAIRFTGFNQGVDYRWYTSDVPDEHPRF